MKHVRRRTIIGVLAVAALTAACAQSPGGAKVAKIEPVRVEKIEGTKLSRVSLTDRAAQRLAIATVPFQQAMVVPKRPAGPAGKPESGGVPRKVVPYSAVIYDVEGTAWTYISAGPLTFVRHPIKVDYVDGDLAVLVDGPPPGSSVVAVGAAELFGAELGLR
jgi:hypothetical protein